MAEREKRVREPEAIGDILKRVLAASGVLDRKKQDDLVLAWRDVVGPRIAEHTRVRSFRSGVLTVGVDSAPLRQELEVFQREELEKALRHRLSGAFVEKLRFTLL